MPKSLDFSVTPWTLPGLWHEPHEEQWQKAVFPGEMAFVCLWLERDVQDSAQYIPLTSLSCACSEQKHGQTHTPKPNFLEYEWSSSTSLKRDFSQASTLALKRWILIFAVVWQLDAVFTNICRHSMIKQMPPVLQKNAWFISCFTHKYLCCSVFESCWEQWSSLSSQLSKELCLYTAPYGHRDNVSGQMGTQPGSHSK